MHVGYSDTIIMFVLTDLPIRYTRALHIPLAHDQENIPVICILLYLIQIGNQRNYYLFMDGEELREVTKDLSELMITKTGTLKAEQKVIVIFF